MSTNNISPSSLLTSYIEKQNSAATQNSAIQNPAPTTVKAQPVNQPQTPYTAQPDALEISNPETQNTESANKKPAKKKLSKKVIFAGIGAAVIIAGIAVFAVWSHKKPQISPELETALKDLVDTTNDFFGF